MIQFALDPNTCSDILSFITNDNIFPPQILPPPPTIEKRKVCQYLCIGTTKIWIETLLSPTSVILALSIYSATIILMNSTHSFNHKMTGRLYFCSFIYIYVALKYHFYSLLRVIIRFFHNFIKWLLFLPTEYFTLFFLLLLLLLFFVKSISISAFEFLFYCNGYTDTLRRKKEVFKRQKTIEDN